MGFRIEEFVCSNCECRQEQLIKNTDKRAEKPCEKCGAPADELESAIGCSTHGGHISWSKWRAL